MNFEERVEGKGKCKLRTEHFTKGTDCLCGIEKGWPILAGLESDLNGLNSIPLPPQPCELCDLETTPGFSWPLCAGPGPSGRCRAAPGLAPETHQNKSVSICFVLISHWKSV